MNSKLSFLSLPRLALALVLMCWGQFVFAEDYYWTTASNPDSTRYGSSAAACEANRANREAQEIVIDPARSVSVYSITQDGTNRWLCRLAIKRPNASDSIAGTYVFRFGTGCDLPLVLNPVTGSCESEPEEDECPDVGESLTAAVNCSLVGGNYVHKDQICVSGCLYTSAPNGFFKPYPNYDDKAKSFCMASFASTGQPCSENGDADDVPPEQTAPEPGEDDETPPCLTVDGHEFCQDPDQPNCGTRDGNPYCYGDGDTCGELNGQHVCLPNGSRKCTYVDGVYECVDDKTGEKIRYDSPDHPNNGGNADGNEHNDEQAPGAVTPGTGEQRAGGGATNKSIHDLQEALGEKLDAIGEALTEKTESSSNTPETPTERGDLGPDEWDEKIEEAKLELSTLTNQFGDLFQGITSLNLSGSGGQLYCESFTAMGRTYELCLSQYADQLEGIGLIILFLAALLAAYIIFIRN